MFQRCDCYNNSYIWDSLYVNQSQKCMLKMTRLQGPCYGDLECEDFNYLSCVSGTCQCAPSDYWDGARCQQKRTYLDPCTGSFQCDDTRSLVCALGPANTNQCVCGPSSYWANCTRNCTVAKSVRLLDDRENELFPSSSSFSGINSAHSSRIVRVTSAMNR